LERSATLEAVHQLRRGLEGVAQMPTDARRDRLELALYTHLGPALIATHGYAASDVEEAYTRMQQLCDSEPHHQALWELFSYHVARGELHHSQADAEKIMALAEKEQAASLLAQARHGVGICLVFRGELESSRPYLTPAADDEPKGIVHYGLGHDPGVGNTATLALTDWLEGRLASSLERIEAAQAQARRLDHPYTEGFAIFFAAWIHQLRGEPKPTEELSRELLQLARQQSFPWFVAKGEFFLGWALTTTGRDPESGMERIRASIQAVSANGVYLLQTHALAIYAELCLNRGLLDSAREALSEATQIYRRTGERFWEAEISRLGGEFLQQEGDLQGAQTAFRHALETSQRQGFHSLELAAALSLSRLLAASGERRAAREVLAGPYRLFARGELTPVVLAAGRELDELD
jgi:tetratricopeptide (TPR) repeat protein